MEIFWVELFFRAKIQENHPEEQNPWNTSDGKEQSGEKKVSHRFHLLSHLT